MAIISEKSLFNWREIDASSDISKLKSILEVLDDEEIVEILEDMRKGKRDDYPVRAIWNSLIAGIVFQHQSIASLERELMRNAELREACGFDIFRGEEAVPPKWVYTRFLKKVVDPDNGVQEKIDEMMDQLIKKISEHIPDLGKYLVIDGKAIESNSVGKKDPKESSDPDADWGKKEYKGIRPDGSEWSKVKSWFGYNLHLLVDAQYEIPLAYILTKASLKDMTQLLPMVEEYSTKHPEMINTAEYLIGDKGYDSKGNIAELYDVYNIKPIIDIRNMWKDVKDSDVQLKALNENEADNISYDFKGTVYCCCEQGADHEIVHTKMVFSGFEADRNCLKYRCPAAVGGYECSYKSSCGTGKYSDYGRVVRIILETDRRVFTPVARSSLKFIELYKKRSSVERVNNRIDNVYGLEKHFIRGKAKMTLRVSMTLVIMLALSLARIKLNEKENMRSLVNPIKKAA